VLSVGILKYMAHLSAVCLVLLVPAMAQCQQDRVVLSLPEARTVAVHALATGRPELAVQIAAGLLQADPRSSYAHFVLANAYADMGRHKDGRKSAARAFRYTKKPAQKFEAAELAARISYADSRPTLTQLWLRRAVQNAPNEQVEKQLARDYGSVRQQNPFSFSLRGELRPSSNVNNGADTALQVIDGLPFTGQLSGSAQALAGLVGAFDGTVGYRLRGTPKSRTDLAARIYVQRTHLDGDARALAPDLSNSDLGSTYGKIELGHRFAVGTSGGSARLSAALGQYWSSGNLSYSFVRLEGARNWRLDARSSLSLNVSIDQRLSARSDFFDSTTFGVEAGAQHTLAWGDRTSVSVTLQQSDSDFVNSRVSSAALRMSYSFSERIGPAQVSGGLVFGILDFPDYFAVFDIPDGRQDTSTHADINFFLPDLDYAGFAPTLRLRAGRSRSNISRFDTRELSVSVSVRSKF